MGKGATLAGTGTVINNAAIANAVNVNPGGFIRGGSPASSNMSDHIGTLTIDSNITINSNTTDSGTIQFEANNNGTSTPDASKISVASPFNLYLNNTGGGKFGIGLL